MDKMALGKVTCGCYRVIVAVFQCVCDVTFLTYVCQETSKNAYVNFAISFGTHIISGGQVTGFYEICLLAILLITCGYALVIETVVYTQILINYQFK
jgi:hypothetical protein